MCYIYSKIFSNLMTIQKLHQQKKKIKMVVSKHLTNFCYPISPMLHQHLNSHVAYPDIPPENSNTHEGNISTCHRTLFSDYSDQSLTKLVHQKEDFRPVSLN